MKKITTREKWNHVIETVLNFQSSIQDASDDGDIEKEESLREERFRILNQCYDLRFHPNIRPNQFINSKPKRAFNL